MTAINAMTVDTATAFDAVCRAKALMRMAGSRVNESLTTDEWDAVWFCVAEGMQRHLDTIASEIDELETILRKGVHSKPSEADVEAPSAPARKEISKRGYVPPEVWCATVDLGIAIQLLEDHVMVVRPQGFSDLTYEAWSAEQSATNYLAHRLRDHFLELETQLYGEDSHMPRAERLQKEKAAPDKAA